MASISIGGKVVCQQGKEPVTVREFGNGGKIAKFSVVDNEYFYVKEDDERKGQFYSVEVSGKAADVVADRLNRGDQVTVHGQLIQRDYNDKTYLDVKNARVTFQAPRSDSSSDSSGAF